MIFVSRAARSAIPGAGRRHGAAAVTGLLLLLAACAGASPAPRLPAASRAELDAGAARQVLVTLRQEPAFRLPRAGSTARGYAGAYDTSARTRRAAAALAQRYGLREVASWPIQLLGVHCVVFELPGDATPQEMVARLERDQRVESAQPMHLFKTEAGSERQTATAAATRYNDPYRELQHGMAAMQVEEAHRWAEGSGVEIAVIDTGVDLEHPELRGHVLLARDFVDQPAQAAESDLHGTAVAGVIASSANNGIGIVGVAPAARLLVLRACWQPAGSTAGVCNSFTLAKALSFAVERHPQIINLSLVGPGDPLLERLLRAAIARGIVVVAAASTDGADHFPRSVAGVLAVRAALAAGEVEEAAASGAPGEARELLVAPGLDVITTTPRGAFDFVSGSSFAAAHVSGVAALLLERRPGLDRAQLHRLLWEASRSAAGSGGTPVMINACAALAKIDAAVRCPGAPGAHPV